MEYEYITLEKVAAIATIILNRPERLNALNEQMAEELLDVFTILGDDKEVRVVVITGAGRAFSSGADVKDYHLKKVGAEKSKPATDSMGKLTHRGCLILRDMGKPIIAAVNGPAAGFGFALALASDIRIASEDARFGLAFVRVGLSPSFGVTYFLPRLIGLEAACLLALTGKIIDAAEAKEMGLVSRVVPANQLKSVTYELASTLAQGPPIAIKLTKQALYQALDSSLVTQLEFEALSRSICRQTADHKEAVKAFIEKRKPLFKGV